MSVRTNLVLSEDVVREVDKVAGPRGRSRYVEEAVRQRLKRERLQAAFESTFGAIDIREHPEWSSPDAVAEWVRKSRAEETDPGAPER